MDDPGLVVQMLVLKLAELPRLRDIEAALAGAPGGSPRTAGPAPAPSAAAAAARSRAAHRLARAGRAGAGRAVGAAAPPGGDPIDRFHELLDSRRRVTAAQVSLAESIGVAGDELVLRFGIDRAAAKEALEEHAARKLLADVAREAFGRPMRIVLKTGPPADGDLGKAAREVPRSTIARERASTRAETDPMVRSAMELFHGELTEIKEEDREVES